jgi:hypothetical protein
LRIRPMLWMPHVISKMTRSSSTIYLAKLYISSDQYRILAVSVMYIIELSPAENDEGNLFVIK